MTLEEFRKTLGGGRPPAGLSNTLQALWRDANGEWKEAHRLVQEDDGIDAARVHAYLHRKEGDDSNARYWYARAKQATVMVTLDEEWRALASDFLSRTTIKHSTKE